VGDWDWHHDRGGKRRWGVRGNKKSGSRDEKGGGKKKEGRAIRGNGTTKSATKPHQWPASRSRLRQGAKNKEPERDSSAIEGECKVPRNRTILARLEQEGSWRREEKMQCLSRKGLKNV